MSDVPAAVPAATPAAPVHPPAPAKQPTHFTTSKTYKTEPSTGPRLNPARAAELVSSAPPPVQRTSMQPAKVAEQPPVPTSQVGTPEAAPAAETVPGVDTQPQAAAPGVETPTAASSPRLEDPEVAARLARISRAEAKTAAEKRELASARAQHAADLEMLAQVKQAAANARQNPLAFMKQAFGVDAQQIYDAMLAENAKKPEDRAADREAQLVAQIQQNDQELKNFRQTYQQEQAVRRAHEYIAREITPLAAKYPFVSHEFGASMGVEVYRALEAEYTKTGVAPRPEVVLDQAERMLKGKYEKLKPLLGASTTPAQPAATPKRVDAPTARQASVLPPSTEPARMRKRQTGKPYTSTPR